CEAVGEGGDRMVGAEHCALWAEHVDHLKEIACELMRSGDIDRASNLPGQAGEFHMKPWQTGKPLHRPGPVLAIGCGTVRQGFSEVVNDEPGGRTAGLDDRVQETGELRQLGAADTDVECQIRLEDGDDSVLERWALRGTSLKITEGTALEVVPHTHHKHILIQLRK